MFTHTFLEANFWHRSLFCNQQYNFNHQLYQILEYLCSPIFNEDIQSSFPEYDSKSVRVPSSQVVWVYVSPQRISKV